MNIPLDLILNNRTAAIRWGAGSVLVLVVAALLFNTLGSSEEERYFARPLRIEVERAASGHSIKLKTGERLNYAGIRTPYKQETMHDDARKRNSELVDGQKVRVRYDAPYRDRKGRLLGYVSVGGQLVNETLVREGLAYVRLTPETKRFADILLAAQTDAREHRRGIWRQMSESSESTYPADPKYGNFHRPSCGEVEKIKPERLVAFRDKDEAFDKGFAPCSKCLP